MSTFTSTLPNHLLDQLGKVAKELGVPKNKIIEKALTIYMDQLNKAAYIRSYKQMADDADMLIVAEEGMADYLTQLEEEK